MQAEGFCVSTAADGLEAIALFDERGADLIILDVNMPGVDGFEVCEMIKRSSQVPVIFLTGANLSCWAWNTRARGMIYASGSTRMGVPPRYFSLEQNPAATLTGYLPTSGCCSPALYNMATA
ncbi:MAG: response regulator [Gemmatimonadetes bacterium]|nr:response regulator [Gemmatimonadota bacterium]